MGLNSIPPSDVVSAEDRKAATERRVFLEFARLSDLRINTDSVESRRPPEPDIRCIVADEPVAFELVELCDPGLAKNIGDQNKLGVGPKLIWGQNVSEPAYQSKLQRPYATDVEIELLCYSGRTVMPDKVTLEHLRAAVSVHGLGQFRRVWFLGHGSATLVSKRP